LLHIKKEQNLSEHKENNSNQTKNPRNKDAN
jgi:hypothetical protein